LVRYQGKDFVKKEILRDTTPFMQIQKHQSKTMLAFEYIELGIFHILSGYDHLLFVLLLFLLTTNLKSLLYTISAFTLAHSITLSCGILGIVYLPPPLVESMIALSIIFLAKELLITHITFTKRHLAVVAFSFGLLHGFGFSSVLQDIGLPHNEIPLSLFSFNVGIEIGQILFITFASFVVYLLKLVHIKVQRYYSTLAYMAGSLAAFWFIQRVLTF
jgi:hydrogenase/urease accessory protein HupE